MKIKKKKRRGWGVKLLLTVLLVILVSVLLFMKETPKNSSTQTSLKEDDTEVPTEISYNNVYGHLENDNPDPIYQDSIVSIYIVKDFGIPYLVYNYPSLDSDRKKNDRFYLHIHLKDSTRLVPGADVPFLNLDFAPDTGFEEVTLNGKKNYLIKKKLAHYLYKDDLIELTNIDTLNTGRYSLEKGRLHEANNITIPPQTLEEADFAQAEELEIEIDESDYKKIKQKRDHALASRVLLTSDEDLVKASISSSGSAALDAEIRLKGDWTDHLKYENKWSYRIIMEGDKTLYGMRKFSIQHPVVRNYLWEWLFNKTIKDQGLMGLRYEFVNVTLNVKSTDSTRSIPMGIMAVEESFDKILIENNQRREGLVLAFDESLIWRDREKQMSLDLRENDSTPNKALISIQNAHVRAYNQNKVFENPVLRAQFETGKKLLEGLRDGTYTISEVFDMDKLTTFVALSNLFGGYHGLIGHNLRIYFNPVTNKLEPISFDSLSGIKLSKIVDYPFSRGDEIYTTMLTQKLKQFSNSSFVNDVVNKYGSELKELHKYMNDEFEFALDLSTLAHNSNFIKKQIDPSDVILSTLESYTDKTMTITIENVSIFPVEIIGLNHINGRTLSKRNGGYVIAPNEKKSLRIPLKKSFLNAFVSKKKKEAHFRYPNDVEKLKLVHRLVGLDEKREGNLIPYPLSEQTEASSQDYLNNFVSNYKKFDFIKEDTTNKTITFLAGDYVLDKNLILPEHTVITISPGFNLDLKNGASITFNSAIQCEGTALNPIRFYSSDGTGEGLLITNAAAISNLDYCRFTNLSNPKTGNWTLSGAVNFNESEVYINNSIFEDNRSEDGLNIIRSKFEIRNSHFENSFSDAFDGDFVTGTLKNCSFKNLGNDGIDVSGSEINLAGITLINPSDKGISAGENSIITGSDITIEGGEIGIVSKDLSKVTLKNIILKDTRLGFSAFQKKTEFGKASIAIQNLKMEGLEEVHLIENGSSLAIDDSLVPTVTNGVIEQMYGNKYGKSTK